MSCVDIDRTIKVGTTYPPIRCRLTEKDGTRISALERSSITSATFKMVNLRTGDTVVDDEPADLIMGEIIDLQYQQNTDDVATPGVYKIQFTVTYSGGRIEPFPGEGFGILTIEESI